MKCQISEKQVHHIKISYLMALSKILSSTTNEINVKLNKIIIDKSKRKIIDNMSEPYFQHTKAEFRLEWVTGRRRIRD